MKFKHTFKKKNYIFSKLIYTEHFTDCNKKLRFIKHFLNEPKLLDR